MIEAEEFGFKRPYELYQNWRNDPHAAREWEKTITKVEEKKGNLYLLMRGFQGITLPLEQYLYQIDPILKMEGAERWKVDFLLENMIQRQKRRVAFERQVKKYQFLHVIPETAVKRYVKTGFHSPDAWARLLGGQRAKNTHIAAHLREIIQLMDDHPKYQIGLLQDDPPSEFDIYYKVFWEVKEGHAVLLENFIHGEEQDVLITEPSVVAAFVRFFTHSRFTNLSSMTRLDLGCWVHEKAQPSTPRAEP
jgi:hypothetical protein